MAHRPTARDRVDTFCRRFGITLPVLEAPMAGVSAVRRAAAIADAGGLGALGAALSSPDDIATWIDEFRSLSKGALQINLWIPDPPPARDATHEARVREFLSQWGPAIPADAGDANLPDFAAQCRALCEARPVAASSIMGLFPPSFVGELKARGIVWFATATTLDEARAAQEAGADAIVAQGFEAGGHRGAFENAKAEQQATGLFALLPRLADHIDVPIIAAGGIADGRGAAAALVLGASAVQIGTALLPTVESETPAAWANALSRTEPEDTRPTRAFSGRLARALATRFVVDAQSGAAPRSAPYPVQRHLTARMRAEAVKENDIDRIQAWAGQSAWLASREPAGFFVKRIWDEAREMLA